jgi:hypothetical protein
MLGERKEQEEREELHNVYTSLDITRQRGWDVCFLKHRARCGAPSFLSFGTTWR